jgi:alpha-D-ribose 1-methylphosphonate 5-phosphate C-P lyase
VLVGYESDSTLALQGKGTGGVEEVREHLKEDKVQYFIVRVLFPKDNAETTRDVFVAYTGPKVGRVAAAKKATNAGVVQAVLKVPSLKLREAERSRTSSDVKC